MSIVRIFAIRQDGFPARASHVVWPIILGIACLGLLAACALPQPASNAADLKRQGADTELAFARTMADRDFAAFTGFLADESVFFSGAQPVHGKQRVADAWKRYFEKPDA